MQFFRVYLSKTVKHKNHGLAFQLLGFSIYSILGVKFDLALLLRSQFFDFLRETLYKHALEHLEAAGLPTVNAYLLLTSLKVCDWSGHIFGASASPRSLTKKLAMSPSSTVHGGQYDAKYVAFEYLLHAAFAAAEIWVRTSSYSVET